MTVENSRAASRRYYARNREAMQQRALNLYYANPAKSHEQSRAWKAANPEKTREIRRREHLKRKYGLTPEQVADTLRTQGGACAGCREVLAGGKKVCPDHDHQTGAFRGVLCHGCNAALGLVKDCPETLRRLANYLQRTSA